MKVDGEIWAILITIIGTSFAFGKAFNDIARLKKDTNQIGTMHRDTYSLLLQIKQEVAVIKNDIEYLKSK